MKTRVLVVDSDKSVRESLQKVLADAGYAAAVAAPGPEAWDRCEQEEIDLLLLDLGLPAKNGWNVFERITRENPALPVIVITAESGQHKTALAAGAGALLQKPLDVTQLLLTVDELLTEPNFPQLQWPRSRRRVTRYAPFDGELLLRELRAKATTPLRGTLPDDKVD